MALEPTGSKQVHAVLMVTPNRPHGGTKSSLS